jgi:hypothetical protein
MQQRRTLAEHVHLHAAADVEQLAWSSVGYLSLRTA